MRKEDVQCDIFLISLCTIHHIKNAQSRYTPSGGWIRERGAPHRTAADTHRTDVRAKKVELA